MNLKQPADEERRSETAGVGRDMMDGGTQRQWNYCPF